MGIFSRGKVAIASLAVFASSSSAFAHHPMGGKTPSTLTEGLLSGVGHPIIGLDHLAFVVAAGVAAYMIGSRFALPLFFVLATLAGTLIHVAGFTLPIAEFVIAVSVAGVGLMVASGRQIPLSTYGALFAVAGLFHGYAYGEAVYGAEATPIIGYLAGFGLVQYAIAIAAGTLIFNVMGSGSKAIENMSARLAGGMVAGAGVLMVGEHALAMVGLS